MACERYREALTDAAAGEPAPAGVEAHLASCEACRAELQVLRQALAMADAEMAGLASAEPSPELAVRIRQAVDASETSGLASREGPLHAFRFAWLWPAMAAAATVLVALTVVISRGQPPAPGPRVAEATPRPRSSATIRTPEAADGPVSPQASGERVAIEDHHAVTPRSSGQAERRGVRKVFVPAEPEVLVPPGEGEALLRFAAHLQTRVVSSDSLLVTDLSGPLSVPQDVEIQPLVIVPLDPTEPSGTD
jgi:hypothetical protein